MKFSNALFSIATTCFASSCAHPSTAFRELVADPNIEQMNTPISGSYSAGKELFNSANPNTDAAIVLERLGMTAIYRCNLVCDPVFAAEDRDINLLASTKINQRYIPGCSDFITEDSEPYCEAAEAYALKFNAEILKRSRSQK